ncbi:MAG TPA: alpha-mannosidase [Phycisphaerae bacterium]|nr:alpha-mannosidase [Phycisphaerae bacterium]
MITVHMVGNAHLDPVWLWEYPEGVDTVLATARSACDRLDEYPQFVFTCAGSWFYRQVEQIDGPLFERIRRFVAAGRWQPVGGMVIQPDCNLPMGESFAMQLGRGQDYYREKFGRAATVGYNVDSFGHAAYLPRFLREAGLDSYVFLRPMSKEKSLPSRLFRWAGPDGHEVTAFRLARAYCTRQAEIREHVEASLGDLPEGVEHTMCFYGVGDHGGGPTRAQIEWILANADAVPGARLALSGPRAFFDAVAPHRDRLPVVRDELQIHAIGCYAVERRIKTAMRRAEHRLLQAGRVIEQFPRETPPDASSRLRDAWDVVLFNQFHDILCGTSVDEAGRRAAGQLIAAEAAAIDIMTCTTRKAMRDLAQPGAEKIVLLNPSDAPFDGHAVRGLMGRDPWKLRLVDESGQAVPFQPVAHEAMVEGLHAGVFGVTIPPGGRRVLRLETRDEPRADAAASAATDNAPDDELDNGHVRVQTSARTVRVAGWTLSLDVRRDSTDTWSHNVDRYAEPLRGRFAWRQGWRRQERGPVRWALAGTATFGQSRVLCRLMQFAGKPMVRVRLEIVWAQSRELLQLRLAAPGKLRERVDLVSGGPLVRQADGVERPLNGGLLVATARRRLGVVAPEVFSVSADPRGVSLTLLRSPHFVHHRPAEAREDRPVTDQGSHTIELDLYPDFEGGADRLASLARSAAMTPMVWEVTG